MDMKSTQNYLASQGIGLVGVLDCQALPADVLTALQKSVDVARYARLVVFANTGGSIWHRMGASATTSTDPLNEFSIQITQAYCNQFLASHQMTLLYPGEEHMVPLQQVGIALGWGKPSPLGIGIHPIHGLWWAFRSAFLTTAELEVSQPAPNSHPCDSCANTPCVAACPAKAVQTDAPLSIERCFTFRHKPNSPCQARCLARRACPVGAADQYEELMERHVYLTSMSAVKAYVKG